MAITDKDLERILKIQYDESPAINEPLYKLSKTYGMIPKKRGGGLEHTFRYKVAESRGIGRQYAPTFTRVTGGIYGPAFRSQTLNFDTLFGCWTMPVNQKLRANKKGKEAYINLMMKTVDSLMHSMSLVRLRQMWGDGTGGLAKVKSYSSNTITLDQPLEVRFLLGIGFKFALVSSAGVIKKSTAAGTPDAEYTITKINEDEGTVTITKSAGSPDPAANDVIHLPASYRRPVDIDSTGDKTNFMMGFENACPATRGTVWGLDQTENPARLAGIRYKAGTTSGETIGLGGTSGTDRHETILRAIGRIARRGGKFEYGVMNTPEYTNLIIDLGDKVRYNKVEAKGSDQAKVGFQAVNFVDGSNGCRIMSEDTVHDKVMWGLNFRDHVICTLTKKFINAWNYDGDTIDRVQGQDTIYGTIDSRAFFRTVRFKNLCRIEL